MHWFYYDNLLPSDLFNIKTKTFSKQTHEPDQPDYALVIYWFYYNNLLPSNFFNSKTSKTTAFSKQAHEADQPAQARRIDWPRSVTPTPAGVCTVGTVCTVCVHSVHTAACARPRVAHARGACGSTAWIHRAGYLCAVVQCTAVPVQIHQNFVMRACMNHRARRGRARANEIDYMNFSYAFHRWTDHARSSLIKIRSFRFRACVLGKLAGSPILVGSTTSAPLWIQDALLCDV